MYDCGRALGAPYPLSRYACDGAGMAELVPMVDMTTKGFWTSFYEIGKIESTGRSIPDVVSADEGNF
jgi:hypothetical protein